MTRPVAADVDRCPCWDFTPPTRPYLLEHTLSAAPHKSKRKVNWERVAFWGFIVEALAALALWRWMR